MKCSRIVFKHTVSYVFHRFEHVKIICLGLEDLVQKLRVESFRKIGVYIKNNGHFSNFDISGLFKCKKLILSKKNMVKTNMNFI